MIRLLNDIFLGINKDESYFRVISMSRKRRA